MEESLIEPQILPLVKAINDTKLFRTFSSCEGHYNEGDQDKYMDRNRADVRFDPIRDTTLETTEHFITYLMTEFNNRHGFVPITLTGYKLYAPDDNYESTFVFVVEFTPFDRLKSPIQKRIDTDTAILQAAKIVKGYLK